MDCRIPASTYRLQLHHGFSFRDARAILPYLSRLGVTDCYLSPCLRARPGSPHGYDICDHAHLSDELGGESEFDALAREARRRGMGLVLDFVPNHMGVDAKSNRWWWEVLENGQCSPFARFFDIDWHPIKSELEGKLLLPILGVPYGEALERGELRVGFAGGRFVLRYFDHELPIDPRSAPPLLERGLEELRAELGDDDGDLREYLSIVAELRNLPTDPAVEPVAERQREKEVARERLERLVGRSPRLRRHVEEAVRSLNGEPGQPHTFDALHELLDEQAYRLAYWKTASYEINYRRFFDINDLAALRMEDPAVFEATHALILRLARERAIRGLRLDHVDGLFDPKSYLEQLREATGPLYVVVEKILTGAELLRDGWASHGTTGYDFLNDVNGVFVESRSARLLRRLYERFSGRRAPFHIVAYVGRKLIIETSLASEMNVLAEALNRISERDRRSRDFTLQSLRDALTEIVACFPVYRTYVDAGGAREFDRRTIDTAIEQARRRNPAMEPSIFDFIRRVLLADAEGAGGEEQARRLEFAMKFQQYTGPVQAKGLEDTAFYRYNLLGSLNEVGGDPQRVGRSVADFHQANRHRRERWPCTMLATTTHDTKRSEDVRARLNLLSEIPAEWSKQISLWSRLNAVNRTRLDGERAPDRNDEFLFYQSLLGVWPIGATAADEELVRRLADYMAKAAKEAKLHTSWINPNDTYDRALRTFVEKTLTGRSAAKFLGSFLPFQQRLARLGIVNSLAQLVLKIGSPGVPDFYQGCELWDLSLVDPDNRRPVAYELRERMLGEMEPLLDDSAAFPDRRTAAADMLEGWSDGRIKLYVTARGLRLRGRATPLFLEGDYLPLEAEGARADHVVAFARRREDDWLIAVVPRLVHRLTAPDHLWPLGERTWGDSTLTVPEALAGRTFADLFSGERFVPQSVHGGARLALADVLRHLPVTILASE
jgi:(1->4)-alpha-D-glucan 1-alpha-D-glucosylmutase